MRYSSNSIVRAMKCVAAVTANVKHKHKAIDHCRYEYMSTVYTSHIQAYFNLIYCIFVCVFAIYFMLGYVGKMDDIYGVGDAETQAQGYGLLIHPIFRHTLLASCIGSVNNALIIFASKSTLSQHYQ